MYFDTRLRPLSFPDFFRFLPRPGVESSSPFVSCASSSSSLDERAHSSCSPLGIPEALPWNIRLRSAADAVMRCPIFFCVCHCPNVFESTARKLAGRLKTSALTGTSSPAPSVSIHFHPSPLGSTSGCGRRDASFMISGLNSGNGRLKLSISPFLADCMSPTTSPDSLPESESAASSSPKPCHPDCDPLREFVLSPLADELSAVCWDRSSMSEGGPATCEHSDARAYTKYLEIREF